MKNQILPSFISIVIRQIHANTSKHFLVSFLLICFILPLVIGYSTVKAQPFISTDTVPAVFEVESLVRNGNSSFEAVLYTPGTTAPGEPGGESWQMDPPGSPIWNSNGNFYGDTHAFIFTYVPATGTTTWKIDFNRDGDFDDPEESVYSVVNDLVGLGFTYVNITGQGLGSIQVTLENLVVNSVNFGSFTSSNTPFNLLLEEISGLFMDVTVSGNFSFSGNGGQDFPNILIRLGSTNEPPACEVTSPLTGSYFDIGDTITITGTAVDNDGTIALVEFYFGVTKIGEDSFPPYSLEWIDSIPGTLSMTIRVIDNFGASAFSAAQMITSNSPPSCTIIDPVNAEIFYDPVLIPVEVMVMDINDYVALVEFFLDSVSIGLDSFPPFQNFSLVDYPMGLYSLTAKATDSYGVMTLSAPVQITVRCIPEDIDNNGIVNTIDFLLFLQVFGSPCSNCAADFNFDGVVSTIDFLHLLTRIGHTCN